MIADAIEALVNKPGFQAKVYAGGGGNFEVGADDDAVLAALLLRRARARAGLSLAEVASRLGAKSVNAYARYEQGRSVPSVAKLSRLYAAVGLASDLVLIESTV
ncbi:MAG: helix-turn-helix transcriptional regulator [Candidatus Aminicenantes bacterium]|nr:helix-turn-helix transcriptional regulator [Candidatus Aminicenantes bacterium]